MTVTNLNYIYDEIKVD